MPVHLGIVVEVNVDAIGTCAVEIAGERCKGPLQIGRTTGRVIPWIADGALFGRPIAGVVAVGGIVCQRVAIAIGLTVERHSRVDAVVEGALDHISESRLPRGRKHAPVPHHVADCGATFAVGAGVGQLVGVSEGFASLARSDAAVDIELMRRQILPERIQGLPVGWIAGLKVIVRCAAARIHCTHGMPFKLGPGVKRNAAARGHSVDRARVLADQRGEIHEISLEAALHPLADHAHGVMRVGAIRGASTRSENHGTLRSESNSR